MNTYYQFLPSGVVVGAGMVVGTKNNEKKNLNPDIFCTRQTGNSFLTNTTSTAI